MRRPVWIEPAPVPDGHPMFDHDPLLNLLLVSRVGDAVSAADFLDSSPRPAPDPSLLPGMTVAARRVSRAIADDESIAIYGDYDVDGISATALLVHALGAAQKARSAPRAYLPTRANGYGLNPAAIDDMASAGVSLLIAVDCGSTDSANVARAQARGLDVVILDHHQMDGPGPAGAFVASAQFTPEGPYREMAAAGVAYLLTVELSRLDHDVGNGLGREPVSLLDLVALGTIGDVAPLIGVNRHLVRDGLRVIADQPRPGVSALSQRAGVPTRTVTAEQVAFKLAPRLNAAGRMADPRLAFDLLMTDDPREAARLAQELETLNSHRRTESQRVVTEAEDLLARRPDLETKRLLVLTRPGWGAGVLGLAAGRLAERFGRPVIVLSDDGEMSRGSARSVPGFDITRGLASCSDLLQTYGGHSQAAGLTIPTASLPILEQALEAALVAADISAPGPPALRIDADLPVDRLNARTASLIGRLEPFGLSNPLPLLRVRRVRVRSYNALGADRSHLKMHLETPNGVVPALFWGAAERSSELVRSRDIDVVATLGFDYWNNERRLHIEIKDFRPSA